MTQDPNEAHADNADLHHATNGSWPSGIVARNQRSLILTVAAVAAIAAAGTAWLGVRLDAEWLALTGVGVFLAMAVLWSAFALVAAFKLLKTARRGTAPPASAATSDEANGVDRKHQGD